MKKILFVMVLLAVALTLTASVRVAPQWDACPPPAFRGELLVVRACVHQVRECPTIYGKPYIIANTSIQCWVWFPGDATGAYPEWRLNP